jgi:hypothetical protein
MNNDLEKLNALRNKVRVNEAAGLLDNLMARWYINRILAKKRRTLNAIKWIHFQLFLHLYWKAFYIAYFAGKPTERDQR